MASSVLRYERFTKGVATWLRTSTGLVSLTGYTTSNVTIFVGTKEDVNKTPACAVFVGNMRQMAGADDVDKALYDTIVRLVCRNTSQTNIYKMLAEIEDLAQQTVTDDDRSDASFTVQASSVDVLKTEMIKYLGPEEPQIGEVITEESKGVFRTTVLVNIIWREV